MEGVRLDFIAKWTAKIIEAVERGGVFQYEIKERFVPVSEVQKPYNVNAEWSDKEARQALFASDAVDLVSSFSGHNVDLSQLVIEPKTLTKRFFTGNGTEDLQDGDAMLILVPMN